MSLGTNISRLRGAKNLSQGDLADALGVSRQSDSKWETDASVPELDKLVKLAGLFGVTLDELVTGETSPEPSPVPPSPPPRQGMSGQRRVESPSGNPVYPPKKKKKKKPCT